MKTYTLKEYQCLYKVPGREVVQDSGHIGLPKSMFEEINNFVLQNNSDETQLLKPTWKKGIGKCLQAQQYVGVIQVKQYTIEILPKVELSPSKKDDLEEEQKNDPNIRTRKVFLKMLSHLKNSPFKNLNKAQLDQTRMNLLEVFIMMFCEELADLVRKGIKSDYISKTENAKFLKGRLLMGQHIQKNLVHKERFYVEFDEYQIHRIENRLIRTTLDYLYKKSSSNHNKKRLREYLFVFEELTPVHNISSAFAKVKNNRQMKDYEQLMDWCKVFLQGSSFSTFKGNSQAYALLFDMNKIFEDYVAWCLKKSTMYQNVQTQVKEQHLLIDPDEFLLKPDLKFERCENEERGITIIADTKWKQLDASKAHNGISQSDIYQMYAYGKKYDVGEIWLIFPWSGDVDMSKLNESRKFESDLELKLKFFDCERGIMSSF